MKTLYTNGSRTIIALNVKEAKSQNSKSGKHQIVLKDGDTSVFFTDNQPGNGLASRIDKLAERQSIIGANLIVDATRGDNGVLMANAFSFGRNMFQMKNGENTEYVFVGYPTNTRNWGENDKNFSFRMAVERWDSIKKERKTVWYEMSFTDIADTARKLIGADFKGLVAVHAKTVSEREAKNANGTPRLDENGEQIVYRTAYADEITLI